MYAQEVHENIVHLNCVDGVLPSSNTKEAQKLKNVIKERVRQDGRAKQNVHLENLMKQGEF